jgi:hypothetical protein
LTSRGVCPDALLVFPQTGFNGAINAVTGAGVDVLGPPTPAPSASLVNNTNQVASVYTEAGFVGPCQTLAPGQAVPGLGPSGTVGYNHIISVAIGRGCPSHF